MGNARKEGIQNIRRNFRQRHALSMSFNIFVITHRVTNFLPKLMDMLLFSTGKKNWISIFLIPLFLGVALSMQCANPKFQYDSPSPTFTQISDSEVPLALAVDTADDEENHSDDQEYHSEDKEYCKKKKSFLLRILRPNTMETVRPVLSDADPGRNCLKKPLNSSTFHEFGPGSCDVASKSWTRFPLWWLYTSQFRDFHSMKKLWAAIAFLICKQPQLKLPRFILRSLPSSNVPHDQEDSSVEAATDAAPVLPLLLPLLLLTTTLLLPWLLPLPLSPLLAPLLAAPPVKKKSFWVRQERFWSQQNNFTWSWPRLAKSPKKNLRRPLHIVWLAVCCPSSAHRRRWHNGEIVWCVIGGLLQADLVSRSKIIENTRLSKK